MKQTRSYNEKYRIEVPCRYFVINYTASYTLFSTLSFTNEDLQTHSIRFSGVGYERRNWWPGQFSQYAPPHCWMLISAQARLGTTLFDCHPDMRFLIVSKPGLKRSKSILKFKCIMYFISSLFHKDFQIYLITNAKEDYALKSCM